MRYLYLLFIITSIAIPGLAQQVLSSEALPVGYSDNAAGTEIINTPAGQSVHFAATGSCCFNFGGSFEHIGQFYVADNGVYDGSYFSSADNANGRDYFGYAPADAGSNHGPYLGSGIIGASPSNGGTGAGKPRFGNLTLTSVGLFPVAGGMTIVKELIFGTSGGAGSSIITVPDGKDVTFYGATSITGANDANYINGRVVFQAFNESNPLFPVGDPANTAHPYHPMRTSGMTPRTAAQYINANPLTVAPAYLEAGIGAVSTVGYWKIDGLATFTQVSVSIPQPAGLGPNPDPANLRLVGWTGSKWIMVGGGGAVAPAGGNGSDLNGYTLYGGMPNHVNYTILALGIGIAAAALPVNLVSFTGSYTEGTGALLTWQTSLETNNDHFEIQRSGDAKSFETIGRVQGKGTTQARTDYSFTDADMSGQISYYRLKQVDLDGSTHLSSIISVNRQDNKPLAASITLGPVPTSGLLTLQLPAGITIREVNANDLQGRRLVFQAGPQAATDVSALPAGVYLLNVLTTDGQHLNMRFIKQ